MGSAQSNDNEQMYWIGPYNVKVHISIQAVVAADGFNLLFCDGTQTKRVSPIIPIFMTSAIYKEKYATLRNDNNYYYKNSDDFWLGPYKIRIHVSIPYVVGEDGFNTHYKDNSTTKINIVNPQIMNENIYKFEHCKLMNDGHYYYYK